MKCMEKPGHFYQLVQTLWIKVLQKFCVGQSYGTRTVLGHVRLSITRTVLVLAVRYVRTVCAPGHY